MHARTNLPYFECDKLFRRIYSSFSVISSSFHTIKIFVSRRNSKNKGKSCDPYCFAKHEPFSSQRLARLWKDSYVSTHRDKPLWPLIWYSIPRYIYGSNHLLWLTLWRIWTLYCPFSVPGSPSCTMLAMRSYVVCLCFARTSGDNNSPKSIPLKEAPTYKKVTQISRLWGFILAFQILSRRKPF